MVIGDEEDELSEESSGRLAGKTADVLLTIVCYMGASSGMSIMNKLVILHLPLPVTVVCVQMTFTDCSKSELRFSPEC